MQTINFLTAHFLPENSVGTNRVLSFANELSKFYQINIICLSEKGVIHKKEKVDYTKTITIYYINQQNYNGKSFLKRAYYEIIYSLKLIEVANTLICDKTIVTIPFMFLIPLVGYKILGYKILDIRDLQWEDLSEKNILNKLIKIVLTMIMVHGIKKFNYITVTNPYESHILSEQYGIDNVQILSNGIDKNRFEALSRKNIQPNPHFTVMYAGTLGIVQELRVLLDAARYLKDVKFILIGDGSEAKNLQKYAKIHQLSNVTFPGKVTWEELIEYYSNTSVLYAQLNEDCVSAMPSKLYEYTSVGLPIIYGGIGQAKSFVESLENAIVIKPNDTNVLIQAIEKCRKMSNTISDKNRALIKENYIREGIAIKILDVICR
ncbi:MAG: glycosyltransferase [Sulfuricurvum sp.]|uniref:glycosyltransferase n=1 Tax=Sulfuricurvum sp. TaxID=2025608 RepID=UPI002611851C|nr:glycosyltransferase [Sulfuricurvum sp.]MDD2368738.1 glycosyltransferase [Sulfuricurvum sp.]MDD2949742.1 glycosyltransferase [Sulfuricurvum sp.]MDD5116997.1 glycosyltransferase [Sulfuricurvum sp.]